MTREELAQKIAHVTFEAEDPDVVFDALMEVFIFSMSCVCADCRRNIARKLEADIPAMLTTANKFAEMRSSDAPNCH
jgi:hypothetical protein